MKTLLLSIALLVSSYSPDEGMQIVKTDQGYRFEDQGVPVLFYQTKMKASDKGTHARANYCHPVYGLDGEVLTQDFPPSDHPHHRGIFWGWHRMLIGETAVGDMWTCQDFTWDVHDVQLLDKRTLQSKVYWKSPLWKNGQVPIAEETVTIRVHKVKNDARAIDFTIAIQALEKELRIGGSDDAKGYGGFSTRLLLPSDIAMNDAKSSVIPQKTAVPAGDWMNFTGTFGTEASGYAIFVHPGNPGGQRTWLLRSKKSMQNAVFPGRVPVPVSTEKPLVLKYRVVIHKDADLDTLFKEYVGTVR
ncbi:MAG: PmoA family protein [Kiritimatiellales bacterium]|nr:PmoA family protein [Kiritimatiellales bacterium]